MPTDTDLLKARIRSIPDFPKPGILFTTYPAPAASRRPRAAIDGLSIRSRIEDQLSSPSRARIHFRIGGRSDGAGFVPVRSPAKLPVENRRATYDLDYGPIARIHLDRAEGQRVLIWTDFWRRRHATVCELAEGCGGDIHRFVSYRLVGEWARSAWETSTRY